jgi:hypothetical protein
VKTSTPILCPLTQVRQKRAHYPTKPSHVHHPKWRGPSLMRTTGASILAPVSRNSDDRAIDFHAGKIARNRSTVMSDRAEWYRT